MNDGGLAPPPREVFLDREPGFPPIDITQLEYSHLPYSYETFCLDYSSVAAGLESNDQVSPRCPVLGASWNYLINIQVQILRSCAPALLLRLILAVVIYQFPHGMTNRLTQALPPPCPLMGTPGSEVNYRPARFLCHFLLWPTHCRLLRVLWVFLCYTVDQTPCLFLPVPSHCPLLWARASNLHRTLSTPCPLLGAGVNEPCYRLAQSPRPSHLVSTHRHYWGFS